MEKLRRPRGNRTEKKSLLAIEHPRVEMRNGHGGSGLQRLTINFRPVFLYNCGIVADQPLPTDGKAAEALGFRNSRLLQKRQAATARPHEDKLRKVRPDLTCR